MKYLRVTNYSFYLVFLSLNISIMKKYLFIIFVLTITTTFAQQTPDKIYGELFTDVQSSSIFPDSKTFVDCTPKRNPTLIVRDYNAQKTKDDFSLKNFVIENFTLQKQPNVTNTKENKTIEEHIKDLWTVLKRAQDKKVEGSSLLALPKPYIVPGGRFTEVYYWDSYFTMLGLKESGEIKTIENSVDNFAYLINTYGHIPNGNRSYYLSRSQPPFFGMMVQLLASIKGKAVYKKYLPALQKEYNFWMDGEATLKKGEAYKRVVKLDDGTVLNRYCDDLDIPRQEGYKEDIKTAEEAVLQQTMTMRFASEQAMNEYINSAKKIAYKHLRSAAESGWDFGSRWFTDPTKISTIHTTDFAPVDLNSLLYNLENILLANGGKVEKKINTNRGNALKTLFWNNDANFFCDYDFVQKKVVDNITAAGFFPMNFIQYDASVQSEKSMMIVKTVKDNLLKPGGIVSSTNAVGQQWDAPNGWAPQQWVAIVGLEKFGLKEVAKDIAIKWTTLNKKVYKATGKLTEKYNVVDLSLETGGGEYPNLDGFGWTNGVYLALVKKYNLK
jgi:alpha,alpha-trehalase